jgi:UDP-N-acetyl-D-mannosaminuronate dehydrogenase
MWNDPHASIVQAARAVNASMPQYAVDLVEQELKDLKGAGILIFGASYRTGVKETAFSGALELNKLLTTRGADVFFLDPLFNEDELLRIGLKHFHGDPNRIQAIILQTDDKNHLRFLEQELPNCKVVVDGRNIIQEKNLKQRFNILGIGAGT